MFSYRQIFERINCMFKQNSWFLHTDAPFSSVFIPLPHKVSTLKPLIRQLNRKENFSFGQELNKYKIQQTGKEIMVVKSEAITSSSIFGIKFNQETEFVVRSKESGQLSIVNHLSPNNELFGVILFKSVGNRNIKYLNSTLSYTNELLMKMTVMVLAFGLLKVMENSTRIQNYDKVNKKGKK